MQEVKIYVSAAEAVGVVRDYANAKNASAPSLVRGIETMLKLRLFGSANDLTPYPIEQFSGITAWKFVMDADYLESTNYKLQADNAHITVASVEENETTYTEVSIPLLETNTEELAEWLGNTKSKSGLTAELVGYNGDGDAVFVLQIENFTVRNRLISAGNPKPIKPDYLNEAQVRALIKNTIPEEVAYPDLSNINADGKQNIIDQLAYVPGSKQGGEGTSAFALNTIYQAEYDGIAYMWVKSASTSMCSVVLGSALNSSLSNNYMYEKNVSSGIAGITVSAILFVPKGFYFRFWAENHNLSAGYNLSFIPLKGTKL